MRRLTYLVATSLDGYIAGPDGALDASPFQGDHIDYLMRELPETLPTPALAAALGAGIRPFESDAYLPSAFRLAASRAFTSGVMMNTYERDVESIARMAERRR